MINSAFSNEQHYRESVRGLLQLHELEVQGQGDSPEADAVRDSLEGVWSLLSEIERKRLTGLSEDLYSLSEPVITKEMNPQAQRKLVEAYESRQSRNWDKTLEILRRWGTHLDPALSAYVKGSTWMEAGDDATAVLFMKRASELDPENSRYKVIYLHTLSRVDAVAAERLSDEILCSHKQYPNDEVVKAADIRFMSIRSLQNSHSAQKYEELLKILEPLILQMESESSESDSLYVMAIVLTAFCYDYLDKKDKALEYYNRGLAFSPNNSELLTARGILRYGREPNAIDDFEASLKAGVNTVWPFFFLAHHRLINNEFDTCLQISERAIEFEASDRVKANLSEWIAISRCELGMPVSKIRNAFTEAVRFDPSNERIRENFQAFEDVLKTQGSSFEWRKNSESEVQGLGHSLYAPSLAA
jgi:tetratricopeptide (TPR) repeat protein